MLYYSSNVSVEQRILGITAAQLMVTQTEMVMHTAAAARCCCNSCYVAAKQMFNHAQITIENHAQCDSMHQSNKLCVCLCNQCHYIIAPSATLNRV